MTGRQSSYDDDSETQTSPLLSPTGTPGVKGDAGVAPTGNRTLTRCALAFVLLVLAPVVATAQVPTAASLSQSAVSRGQTVEVTVTGKALATVDNIGVADPRGLDVSIVTQTPPAKDDQL